MPRYDGRANLVRPEDRTPEERREAARLAGKASAAARRKKGQMQRLARDVLNLTPRIGAATRQVLDELGVDPDDEPTIALISLLAVAQNAMKGDIQALGTLTDYAGELSGRLAIEEKRLDLERERLQQEATGARDDGRPVIVDTRPEAEQ